MRELCWHTSDQYSGRDGARDWFFIQPLQHCPTTIRAMAAKPSSVSASEYSEGSIRVLKGLEPVKQRPGMYTRTDNPQGVA